jgi:uncharacterized protein involved in exopolysaccharide biosynthesis
LDRAILAFENSLVVEPVGGRVVLIKFSSTNPTRAATIANAVAGAYITDQLDAKYEANRVATNWLQKRQEQLQQQADGAQRAVEAFKKQNNIVPCADLRPFSSPHSTSSYCSAWSFDHTYRRRDLGD